MSPVSRRATPASRSATSTSRPRKSPLSKRTTQARPACSDVIPSPSSWPWSGQSGLEPQRVARAEPGRGDAPGEQPLPHRGRRGPGHVELHAVLAGVPGAGDPARDAVEVDPFDREALHCGPRRLDARERGPGLGTLHREDHAVCGDVGDLALAAAVEHRGLADRVEQRCGVRRVGHHQEVARREPPHDDVVDDVRVVLVEQVRVLRLAGPDAVEIVGERPLQRGERTRALHPYRAEVRHVEHHGTLTARPVLLEHAGVLDRHLPAPEGDHARAEHAVLRVEGTVSQVGHALSAVPAVPSPSPWRARRGADEPGAPSPWSPATSCDGGSRPYFTRSCR